MIRYTDEKFGSQQTEEYLSGLYHSFDLLTDNPKMRLSFDASRRRYIYASHYVYYRIAGDEAHILMVRHTAMREPPRRAP